jgi:pimeloyl-ACP methyl ester carboxylesterase
MTECPQWVEPGRQVRVESGHSIDFNGVVKTVGVPQAVGTGGSPLSMITLAIAAASFVSAPCGFEGVPASFEKQAGIECGWVSVRRDSRSRKTIRLWTARVRASGPAKKRDPILYINGGPGVATVDVVAPGIPDSVTMTALRRDRDIIIFDQRGSGRSEETMCPGLGKALDAISAAGLSPAAEEERDRATLAACRTQLEKSGLALAAYTTAATVADMESLRQAFGVEKWNLLSISYGGLVALHAMRTNPHSIRSVILSSPYPPNSVTWAEQASSSAMAYQAINRACSTESACRDRFGDLVPKLEATLARLERSPLKDGKTLITGRQFASALWPLAVGSKTVRFVPLAIDRAYSGDDTLIKKMVAKFAAGDSFGAYSPAQSYAISCYEAGRTREWFARAKSLYPAFVSDAPADSFDRMCAVFRPGHANPAFFAPVASAIPTLIYVGSLDPATPVIDAYQALRFLSNATLVEVAGASHGPISVDDCTRGIALEFVRKPEVTPNVECVSKRVPVPFATEGLDALLDPGS